MSIYVTGTYIYFQKWSFLLSRPVGSNLPVERLQGAFPSLKAGVWHFEEIGSMVTCHIRHVVIAGCSLLKFALNFLQIEQLSRNHRIKNTQETFQRQGNKFSAIDGQSGFEVAGGLCRILK